MELMLIIFGIIAFFVIDFLVRSAVEVERINSLPIECVYAKVVDKRSQLKNSNGFAVYGNNDSYLPTAAVSTTHNYNNFVVFEDQNRRRYQFAVTDELYGLFFIGDKGDLHIRYDETKNQYHYVNFDREV